MVLTGNANQMTETYSISIRLGTDPLCPHVTSRVTLAPVRIFHMYTRVNNVGIEFYSWWCSSFFPFA
ncbi:hypothetical protein J6590_050525, partial [Homalodisca vitripennis]